MWWLLLFLVCLLVAPIPTLLIAPFVLVALIFVSIFSALPFSIRILLVILVIIWLAGRSPS